MFNMDLQARIRDAKATRRVGKEDDEVTEHITAKLMFEFTSSVAGAMGERALVLHQLLAEGKLASVDFRLGSQAVHAELDDLTLDSETRAIKLKLSCAAKEGASPVAELSLRFPTVHEHLAWFVDRLEEVVPARFTVLEDEQTEMVE